MEAWAESLSKCGAAMAFVINDFRGNIVKIRTAYEEDKEGRNTLKKLVEAERSKGIHKKNKCADPSGAIGACAQVFVISDSIRSQTIACDCIAISRDAIAKQAFSGRGATSNSTSISGQLT